VFGSLTGIVRDVGSQQPLSGAEVTIAAVPGLGGRTDAKGRFGIANVPAGQHEVRARMLGYKPASQTVTVRDGAATDVTFDLAQTALVLDAVVVTGVAAATPTKELAFTVEHLDFSRQELAVIPPSPQGLIQGRVAGALVVRGSGQPGEDADIMLRTPTSITGNQNPLIIVDGVITSGRLSDINPQDIANIEIVKGAAASSLYGSRAQAGVINIKTKRGSTGTDKPTRFLFRTHYQGNNLERPIARSQHHYYKMNADQTAFVNKAGNPTTVLDNRVLDDGGDGSNAMRAFAVNPFPPSLPFRDLVKQFYNPGATWNQYLAVEGTQGAMSYRLSGNVGREEGIIRFHEGTRQKDIRLNVDHRPLNNLTVALSGYASRIDQHLITQGGGGALQTLLAMEPFYDLLEVDSTDGGLKAAVGPPGSAVINPLYQLKTDQDTRRRDRYMGGFQAQYSPVSWLILEGNASYDRSGVDEQHYRPKGYKRAEEGSGLPLPPDQGSLSRLETTTEESNASLTTSIVRNFGDFTSRSQLRYLYERHDEHFWSEAGSKFSVVGVPRASLLTSGLQLDSYFNRTVSEGYFAITSLGYKGKYLVDVLGRRDGSSLFGSNQRWQNYYRASAAWRLTEEPWWPFGLITEFKPRFSQGTAGGRPRYEAQYQTYAVDRGQIAPRILGNADLRPERATEREIGLDLVLGQRVQAKANYVSTKIQDQLLLTPLPGYYGFTAQWKNAGTLESKTWEASLDATLIDRPNLVWTTTLTWDRNRSKITELDVPDYQIRFYRSTMYVVKGEPLGVFFGKKWAKSCADLGQATNCADFDVNDEGYFVYVGAGNCWRDGFAKNLWGTVGQSGGKFYDWGKPIAALPWPQVSKMGQSLPKFTMGWSHSLRLGKLAASALFQGEFGPQIYSGTLQWQANLADADAIYDQANKPKEQWKPVGYYFTFYDVNINNDHWVFDGTFVKLRELSLRYTFSRNQLRRVFGAMSPYQVSVDLVGRNLKTWTSYPGYDPEVGSNTFLGSAVVGRVDENSYPNFRSIGLYFEIVY
jgi:TonB-linked SusC/RagA family outer membrane protein